jgi:hypothetical protein
MIPLFLVIELLSSFVSRSGVRQSPLVLWPQVDLLFQPRLPDEYEALMQWELGGENWKYQGKPAPVPLCPQQISHEVLLDGHGPPDCLNYGIAQLLSSLGDVKANRDCLYSRSMGRHQRTGNHISLLGIDIW